MPKDQAQPIDVMTDQVIIAMRGYVSSEMLAMVRRMDALEGRLIAMIGERCGEGEAKIASDVDARLLDEVTKLHTHLHSAVDAAIKALPPAAQGPQGERGEKGDTGDRGERGEAGDKGDKGDRGDDGINGNRGEKGDAGDRGEKGDTGAAGDRGADGVNGKDGAAGDRGEKGDQGDRGSDGEIGPRGEAGVAGDKGDRGEAGFDGASAYALAVTAGFEGDMKAWLLSLRGADGAAGPRGDAGDRGSDGAVGPAGVSAYDVARSAGFAGDESMWLRSLRGSDGDAGPAGDRGDVGPQGPIGPQGERGFDGLHGKHGVDGDDGREGAEGAPGRDALRLDVLDGIDTTRCYARGTYATHFGGLWRAERSTDAAEDDAEPTPALLQRSGWVSVVDGLRGFTIAAIDDDARSFDVTAQLSSGKTATKQVAVPTVIYRGVWADTAAYKRGDAVTYRGSVFHCEIDDTKQQPEVGTDWKLCVKRGRDGKDGEKGKDGAKGIDGRPGRDAGTF